MAERPEPVPRRRGRRRHAAETRRSALWGYLSVLALLPIIGYSLFVVGQKTLETSRLRNEEVTIRAEMELEMQENVRLQQELVEARGDAQIESTARRYLNLIKPGDQAIVLNVGPPTPTPTPPPVARPGPAEQLPKWLTWLLNWPGP